MSGFLKILFILLVGLVVVGWIIAKSINNDAMDRCARVNSYITCLLDSL